MYKGNTQDFVSRFAEWFLSVYNITVRLKDARWLGDLLKGISEEHTFSEAEFYLTFGAYGTWALFDREDFEEQVYEAARKVLARKAEWEEEEDDIDFWSIDEEEE